jgi:7-cyano-7-deazaguanine synthase
MTNVSSVILLSGGLDSAANLAFCHDRDAPVLALTADYGQRAVLRELAAARGLAHYYGVRHEVVDLSWLGRLGGSALTSDQTIPDMAVSQLDDLAVTKETARQVWVPNRNGILLNVASAFAERLAAARVVVGFNVEEAATFPDNSEEFLDAASGALRFSTAGRVQAYSYTARWDKRRIAGELRKLAKPFPFEQVWSCYQGGEKPCGTCESCRRFTRAVERAEGASECAGSRRER